MSPSTQLVQHACDVLASFLELLTLTEHRITADQLATTFEEIARVGEVLPNRSNRKQDVELEQALRRYRSLLERLRDSMPELHCTLLLERARLEAQRSHLEAANLWAEATRATR